MKIIKSMWLVSGLFLVPVTSGFAREPLRDNYVPTTTSAEAQKVLAEIYEIKAYARVFPAANDLAGWRETHEEAELAKEEIKEKSVASNQVRITEAKLGGVSVLDIRPKGWADDGKVLVYTHGGAYTMFSARSTLNSSAPMSRATGLRVISVDYTTAPFARWDEIQQQVITVFEELLKQGYKMQDIAIYGDSAGGRTGNFLGT